MANNTFDLNKYRERKEQAIQTKNERAEPTKPETGSKITNFEWGFVIAAAICIDGLQYTLDAVIVGVFVNGYIDLCVSMALPFYFYLRGVKPTNKKIFTWIGIPLLDALSAGILSFWTIDVVLTMVFDKAEKKLLDNPIAGSIGSAVSKVEKLDKAA